MYEEHFGLTEVPFSISPDPRYLYMSNQHREALAHLMYGVRRDGGFVLLTGEVGTGKTTVCRSFLEQLPDDCIVAFIINPLLSVRELLSAICDEFRIACPAGNKSLKVFVDRINAYLLDAHARRQRPVLIIDEAQNLSREVLELIRLLTNLETGERKLLQIILLGQPELRDKLARPELRQLSQRIIARFHLHALSRDEAGLYVAHRLAVAGSQYEIFYQAGISEVYHYSSGIPRLINTICDRALLGAYSQGKTKVDVRTVRRAAREVLGDGNSGAGARRWVWPYASAALLFAVVLVSAAVFHYGFKHFSAGTPSPAERDKPAITRPGVTPFAGSDPSYPVLSAADETTKAEKENSPDQARTGEATGEPEVAQSTLRPLHKLAEHAQSGDQVPAWRTLFMQWGGALQARDMDSACREVESFGKRCFSGKGGLEELRKWNRPAVLKLFDGSGREYAAALTALAEDTAVFTVGSETVRVAVSDLKSAWPGEYVLLWPAPPKYVGNIRAGQSDPLVGWLRRRLGRIRGEAAEPQPNPVFDAPLRERVKEFQHANGLRADGILGPETFNRLVLETDAGGPVLMAAKRGS